VVGGVFGAAAGMLSLAAVHYCCGILPSSRSDVTHDDKMRKEGKKCAKKSMIDWLEIVLEGEITIDEKLRKKIVADMKNKWW